MFRFIRNISVLPAIIAIPENPEIKRKRLTFQDIEPVLLPVKRKCWKPVVSEVNADISASKFSGIPWLAADEDWPVCGNCKKPMQLFLQLNKKDLPAEARDSFLGGDILQMFYCVNSCEDIPCEGASIFANDSVLVRTVNLRGPSRMIAESPVEGAFPCKLIAGWDESVDYPGYDEIRYTEVRLDNKQEDCLLDAGFPLMGEKLLGWPGWVQGPEYPECPDCGKKMSYVFQIDSGDNIPYMFGDCGCGHITQCREHPERLAFSWACS